MTKLDKTDITEQTAHAGHTEVGTAGWRPIKTKPRDHFPVLVWGPYGHRVAFYDVTWTWWTPDGAEPIDWTPTDWMPLPKRPAQP
jgi:hypothetical protein